MEEKVCTGLRKWLDESGEMDAVWDASVEIGKKVEEKIKRELRNRADQ